MNPVISPEQTFEYLKSSELILIDARAGAEAKKQFQSRRLSGARFVDLETDLSDIKANAKDGGRHPLPEPQKFSLLLARLGISPEKHVVVYDDRSGAMAAARFWWMLRAMGHERVQVLDGGFEAAIRSGIPVSTTPAEEHESTIARKQASHRYTNDQWLLPTASMGLVEEAGKDQSMLIIDVREPERYMGHTEPYDMVAGHIPGATNIWYGSNLDEQGFFLPASTLRDKYLQAMRHRPVDQVIAHCGSGVSACQTLLAMDYAGLGIPKLYVGSYSEWIRNDKPIIR
jgi:thiosulfate/3-mercaptopyruvate sulfurtransferase